MMIFYIEIHSLESYRRYLGEMTKLKSRIAEERRVAAEAILPEIKYCVRDFGFVPEDIFAVDILRRATKRRPCYFAPVSGATWSGGGRAPAWMRDKDREPRYTVAIATSEMPGFRVKAKIRYSYFQDLACE
ncbi:H-NS histone family protein [Burkholderia cepacia]|uniref:H-NS histone family protein n=1 Tax=Burkholderia cepacia TaxID=292 RepID=UPI0009BB06C9|nr:H-NS histone family protein [Burkholderia cepacia]